MQGTAAFVVRRHPAVKDRRMIADGREAKQL